MFLYVTFSFVFLLYLIKSSTCLKRKEVFYPVEVGTCDVDGNDFVKFHIDRFLNTKPKYNFKIIEGEFFPSIKNYSIQIFPISVKELKHELHITHEENRHLCFKLCDWEPVKGKLESCHWNMIERNNANQKLGDIQFDSVQGIIRMKDENNNYLTWDLFNKINGQQWLFSNIRIVVTPFTDEIQPRE